MDEVEFAQEGLEHAHEAHGHEAGHASGLAQTRRAAILIAAMAAIAVLVEMSGTDAQTSFLAEHVAASDAWAQYQAKSVRRVVLTQSAETLEALHAAPPVVLAARAEAARMADEPGGDGMAQLAERAHEREASRDHERRLHDGYERGVRGLQIAIVLTGLFVATRMRWLFYVGAGLGAVSAVYAGLVAVGVV